jgi:ribosomal protein S18 acetylase RimI-like enzyme
LERYLLSWELFYESHFLDRVSDQTRVKRFQNTTLLDFYSLLNPRWHLAILAISPNHQRKGIGRKLIRYGQKFAAEESLPMTLEASVVGRGLYAKEGFKVVEEGEIVDEHMARYVVVSMAWEPEGLRGKWLVDRGEGRADVKGRN